MDAHWTSTHVPQQSPETDAAVLVLLALSHPSTLDYYTRGTTVRPNRISRWLGMLSSPTILCLVYYRCNPLWDIGNTKGAHCYTKD